MAKVLGLGGIFFKAQNKNELMEWYAKWLNIPLTEYGFNFSVSSLPQTSFSVFSPFTQETDYFDPSHKDFMINLIVDNLDEALDQVKEGGAEVIDKKEEYEFGRFGWFIDPDGNKIELWQPEVHKKSN